MQDKFMPFPLYPEPRPQEESVPLDEREYAAIQLDRAKVFALEKKWYLAMDAIGRATDAIERAICRERDHARRHEGTRQSKANVD